MGRSAVPKPPLAEATRGGRWLWAPAEDDFLRRKYGPLNAEQLGVALGRSTRSAWQRASTLGLTRKNFRWTDARLADLRHLHAEGWSDAEIADELKADRHNVGDVRRRLGLPHNALSQRRRDRAASKTRAQLDAAGLASLADARAAAYAKKARELGWPEQLPDRPTGPRHLQVLHALWTKGPRTRRQLCEDINMPWKGVRKSLTANGKRGALLAQLIAAGLVVSCGRVVSGEGRGKSQHLYMIAPGVSPTPATAIETEPSATQETSK